MRVLIIGAGDLGYRLAVGLGQSGQVGDILFAGLSQGRGPWLAGMIATCWQVPTRFTPLDATDLRAIEHLIAHERPDLIIQSGTLFSPFLISSRQDPLARAIREAGVAVQLARQLPLVYTLMQAVRNVDFTGLVVNLSAPDLTHPVLGKLGLAPTLGLGNVTMYWLRARAALRERAIRDGASAHDLPLVRVLGHHHHGYALFEARVPEEANERCHVYLGEDGHREDKLPYGGIAIPRDLSLNELTAAAALVVLNAFLPATRSLRVSAPGPEGLPGGYPVRIEGGSVSLDLPPGVTRAEAVAFNEQAAARDGIANIADDGTITFTERAAGALRSIAPELVEPLPPAQALERCNRLLELLKA